MVLGIRKAEYIADFKIKLEFNNGETWTVDLENELNGTVFLPLRDKSYFKQFSVVFDTIEWENGADFDPEYLFEIGKIQSQSVSEQAIAYKNTQPVKENMSTEELKLQIHRQIDTLDAPKVKELYGLMLNYINSKKETTEWLGVSEFEQQGIEEAIREMNEGKGISHEQVMSKLKTRYRNA
ncbi:MAG: DUF2442 domain-containing protein [Bacteroidales bacterium]